MLREGDGGKNVHYLQIALEKQGFISDVDDQRWWQFGPSTLDCVLSFQVSYYLTYFEHFWAHLLGKIFGTISVSSSGKNAFEERSVGA